VLWRFGVAIGDFFSGLAFSPKVWAGVIIAGVVVVLFVVTGGLRGRDRKKSKRDKSGSSAEPRQPGALPATVPVSTGTARTQPAPAPARRKGKGKADDDDEFGDVADILRRHGIS